MKELKNYTRIKYTWKIYEGFVKNALTWISIESNTDYILKYTVSNFNFK